jgi:hypothetical protein
VDYIFRWMGSRFLTDDEKSGLGLIDRGASASEAPFGSAPSGPVSLGAPDGGNEESSALSKASADPVRPTVDPVASPSDPVDPPKASAVAIDQPALNVEPAPRVEKVELGYLATVGASNGHSNGHANPANAPKPANGGGISLNLGGTKVAFATQADAPSCMDCGSIMVRNGSCYKCLNCGSTSGCS